MRTFRQNRTSKEKAKYYYNRKVKRRELVEEVERLYFKRKPNYEKWTEFWKNNTILNQIYIEG